MHHIFLGKSDINERPTWVAAREACLEWYPNYEHKLWNAPSADKLILEEYPWFFKTWKSYPYLMQHADNLRYIVVYHYGGIFVDMHLRCRRSLGPLRCFGFISPEASPVGISTTFLMASARHPFMKVFVEQLSCFNRNFIFPYVTVMFSTGWMYLSSHYSLYPNRSQPRFSDYKKTSFKWS